MTVDHVASFSLRDGFNGWLVDYIQSTVDSDVTEDQLRSVAEAAILDGWVLAFPEGWSDE